MIDFEGEEEAGGGAGWLATFADLMSLLMCFFVLLLSFSEMDLAKYKQVAGSMKDAFGVQNEVRAKDIPKGTSIIAREFSPGRPETTILNIVRQQTIQANLNSLDVRDRAEGDSLKENDTGYYVEDLGKGNIEGQRAASIVAEQLEKLVEQTRIDAQKLIDALQDEINEGMIDIEAENRQITIRIRERGSFPSASAELQSQFVPVIGKIRSVLTGIEGQIAVEGHTDSIPISTWQYSSNWSLSASRALSVVEELRKFQELDESRFIVVGHADSIPFAPDNSTESYRALNRRVEIVIRQPVADTVTVTADELESSEASSFSSSAEDS
jgi:chemotaxis protein MotB